MRFGIKLKATFISWVINLFKLNLNINTVHTSWTMFVKILNWLIEFLTLLSSSRLYVKPYPRNVVVNRDVFNVLVHLVFELNRVPGGALYITKGQVEIVCDSEDLLKKSAAYLSDGDTILLSLKTLNLTFTQYASVTTEFSNIIKKSLSINIYW